MDFHGRAPPNRRANADPDLHLTRASFLLRRYASMRHLHEGRHGSDHGCGGCFRESARGLQLKGGEGPPIGGYPTAVASAQTPL